MENTIQEKCNFCGRLGCTCGRDTGLFVIRLALAAVFIAHGWQKWMHLDGIVMFFGKLGFPATLAYLVAAVELLGGVAMLLGVFTKWAGYLLAADMLVAIVKVVWPKGFLGGYELELTLLLTALGVAFAGPGKISLMKLFGGNKMPRQENRM